MHSKTIRTLFNNQQWFNATMSLEESWFYPVTSSKPLWCNANGVGLNEFAQCSIAFKYVSLETHKNQIASDWMSPIIFPWKSWIALDLSPSFLVFCGICLLFSIVYFRSSLFHFILCIHVFAYKIKRSTNKMPNFHFTLEHCGWQDATTIVRGRNFTLGW